jgi:hypothetical protein
MGNIIIKKTTPSPVKTLEIRNLLDLQMMLEVPVVVYAIPESSDDEAMGMKVEGNKSSFEISWTLVDDDTSVVQEDSTIKTADQQMVFLLNEFQPDSIKHAYELKLMPTTGSTPFFTRTGIIQKINISKSGDTPVTYTANITFATATMLSDADNQEVNNAS